ncbi:hypothetical protein [Streptomyces sp. CA-132043]|uniref:hypothetical protein n=1 Tax=Streptomyces sp. CA-132043 TaxID=3240048 RepID=UPI003D8AF956
MVQVDLFLSYGFGAAFTLAAAPAGRADHASPRQPLTSALTATLLYLGLLFVPSGLWLLRQFPAWETMQVSPHPPVWLPAAFPVGITVAGIAGFAVTRTLLYRGVPWAAVLQGIWPLFAFYVTLLYGWDGTGLRRFLTADPAHWPAAAHQSLSTLAAHWISTPVAHTLNVMVALHVPVILVLLCHLRAKALRTRTSHSGTAAVRFAGTILSAMIVLCALAAIGLVLLVNALGPVIGPAAFAAVSPLFLHPRGALARTAVTRWLPAPDLPVQAQCTEPGDPARVSLTRSTDTGIPHHAPPAHPGPDRYSPPSH